jgi:DNA-3-methyladenine glycosylase
MKLEREFYEREDTLKVARDLLGKVLVVPSENGERVAGRIVETEAYLGAPDKAAHAYRNRRTKRTEILFGPGGRAYVFFIYGMYYQLNIVAGREESPHCVLVRGIEPVEGIEMMRARRGPMKDTNLTSGPGKLCIAFGIDKTFYGADLVRGERIFIEAGEKPAEKEISEGPRIGIDYAAEFAAKPWRFWLKDNLFVSR